MDKNELETSVEQAREKIIDAAQSVGSVASVAVNQARDSVAERVEDTTSKAKTAYAKASHDPKVKSTIKTYGIYVAIFVAGLIIGVSLSGDGYGRNKHMDSDNTMFGMTQQLQGLSGVDLEKTFLEEMIDHHQGAIDMAKIVLTDSSIPHNEIKLLAQNIILSQDKEIKMMQSWLTGWYKAE